MESTDNNVSMIGALVRDYPESDCRQRRSTYYGPNRPRIQISQSYRTTSSRS